MTAQQVAAAPVNATNPLQGIKECIPNFCLLQQPQLALFPDKQLGSYQSKSETAG